MTGYHSFRTLAPWLRATPALLAFALGCSSPTDPPGGDGGVVSSVEETVTAAGGVLMVTGTDGGEITLTLPPGALRQPASITLTRLEPTAESPVRFLLAPAGLELAEPATIRIVGPSTPPANASIYLDAESGSVFLRTTATGGGALETELTRFGFGAGAPELPRSDGDSVTLPPSGAGAARGGDSVATGGVSPATCDAFLAAAEGAMTLFLEAKSYEKALAFYTAYQSLAATAECVLDTAQWIATTTALACDGYTGFVDAAGATAVDTYDVLFGVLEPLVVWGGVVAALDGPCFDGAELVTLMESKFAQFMSFYVPELEEVDVGDFQAYKALREEAKELLRVWEQAHELGLADQADQLVDTIIQPFMSTLRTMAYAKCREDGDHYFLTKLIYTEFFGPADVLPTGSRLPERAVGDARTVRRSAVLFPFTDADIQQDLQYCASCLILTSYAASDVGGEPLASIELGSLDAPGQAATEAELTVDPEGHLELAGEIRRFVCFPPSQNAGDYLRVTLEGVEIATVPNTTNPDLLHDDIDLDLAQAFAAIDDEPEPGDTYTLRIWRHRTACPDVVFGDPVFLLFEVQLVAGEAELGEVEVEILGWPDGVSPGESVQITVRAGHRTDDGIEWEDGLAVEVIEGPYRGGGCLDFAATQGVSPFTVAFTVSESDGCSEVCMSARATDQSGQQGTASACADVYTPDGLTIGDVDSWALTAMTAEYDMGGEQVTVATGYFFEESQDLAPFESEGSMADTGADAHMTANGSGSVTHFTSAIVDGVEQVTISYAGSASGTGAVSIMPGGLDDWYYRLDTYSFWAADFVVTGRPFSFVIDGTASSDTEIQFGGLSIVDGVVVDDGARSIRTGDTDRRSHIASYEVTWGPAPGAFHVEGTTRASPHLPVSLGLIVCNGRTLRAQPPETSLEDDFAAEAEFSLTLSR